MTCAYAEHVSWDMLTWLPSQFLLLLLGAPSSSFCHDLAEASPKCTEDRCYIQYGIANVQFLSIGDDMNWDDRWWHVHTQSMLGETCLHGCPVSFFCLCWVLRLRASVMILQKSLQNAPKIDVISSMASQMFSFLALAMIWTEMTDDDMCIRRAC